MGPSQLFGERVWKICLRIAIEGTRLPAKSVPVAQCEGFKSCMGPKSSGKEPRDQDDKELVGFNAFGPEVFQV